MLTPDILTEHRLTLVNALYFLLMLLPLAFIPLAGASAMIPAIPMIAQNLLAEPFRFASIYFHYNALIIPFLFIATILGVKKIMNKNIVSKRTIIATMLLCGIISAVAVGPSPLSLMNPINIPGNFEFYKYEITKHDMLLWEAIEKISPDARVATESRILSQLSSRKYANYYPYAYNNPPEEGIDYILLDTSYSEHHSIHNPMNDSSFILIFQEDGIELYESIRLNRRDS